MNMNAHVRNPYNQAVLREPVGAEQLMNADMVCPQSPMDELISALAEEIAHNSRVLAQLAERMSPVCLPMPPRVHDVPYSQKELAPLHQRIANLTMELAVNNSAMHDLRDSLQI